MKLRHLALGLVLIGTAGAAAANMFVFYTDPMSLSRRMVVIDAPGPHRVLMCMAPPGESGCTEVRTRRRPCPNGSGDRL